MRRCTTFSLAALALLAGACGGPTKPSGAPTGAATPPAPTSPTSSPSPSASPSGQKVVYAPADADVAKTPRDIFVWDAAGDRLSRVTSDDKKTEERVPRFIDEDTISYAVGGTLYSVPLAGGASRKLGDTKGYIAGIDWLPDGSAAVGLSIDYDGPRDALWVYTSRTKTLKQLRSFPNPCGREGYLDDDFSVWWSDDATKILMVETCLEPSVRVLNADGTDASTMSGEKIKPFWGTHARWSCDGTQIYYRDYGAAQSTQKWFSMNLRTGLSDPLGIRDKVFNLAVSPDGCRLAYSSGGEEPVLYVHDMMASTERTLGAGYAAPLWISATELLAARAGACGDVETCGETFLQIQGTGARFDAVTGQKKDVKLRSTHSLNGFTRQADALRP